MLPCFRHLTLVHLTVRRLRPAWGAWLEMTKALNFQPLDTGSDSGPSVQQSSLVISRVFKSTRCIE